MSKRIVDQVYSYITEYAKLGVHPHQLAKALNLKEEEVIGALKELERQGKVRVRSSNIEWKFTHARMKTKPA